MKDATLATRMERAVASFEALVGRLEHLLGRHHAVPAPTGEATPPVNNEAWEAAEKMLERRKEELETRRLLMANADDVDSLNT